MHPVGEAGCSIGQKQKIHLIIKGFSRSGWFFRKREINWKMMGSPGNNEQQALI
jgi:hypothetical protein